MITIHISTGLQTILFGRLPEGTSGWYLGSKVQMEAVAEAHDIGIKERLQECSDAELWRRDSHHWRHLGTSTERNMTQ